MTEVDREVTRELAALGRQVHAGALPPEVLEVARHCVLDWLGVTLAGSREPLVGIVVEQLAAGEGKKAEATLVGSGRRVDARTAALINGAAGHALDFDDTHWVMNGHPTAPVLPAVLALAEREGRGGRALLAALVAGIECECRLGGIMGASHYDAGFHATGTLGTFGAAAAAAHLLALDETGWGHALGLAGTQAAGLKSSFGTMAKPLHAGKAAEDGLSSALLAAAGFTSVANIIEAPQGFAETHHGELKTSWLEPRAERALIRDTLFKYHAACYLTHASIDALRGLVRGQDLRPEHVQRVEIVVAPTCLKVCNIHEPRTGLECKFSLRATAALALLGYDMAELGTYSDERAQDPAVLALRDKVDVIAGDERRATRARVRVECDDGRLLEASADSGEPAADLSAQWRKLGAKFMSLAEPALGEARARQLHETVAHLDDLASIRQLMELARPLD